MTLDEAIAKAKADGDVQLAEWLRQARGADAAARWYTEKLRDANRTIRKLLTENAKLQELFNETLIRLAAASEATGGRFIDARYCELLESHGIEVEK